MEDKKLIAQVVEQLQLRKGLGSPSLEETLEDMTKDCLEELKDYLNNQEPGELPGGCASIVKDLVLIRYNRDGAEGEQSESNSDVTVSYLADLPPALKRRIYRHRKMRR